MSPVFARIYMYMYTTYIYIESISRIPANSRGRISKQERVGIFPGYESAGVTYVNGERVVSGNNANPYANANAPPPPPPPANNGVYHQPSSSSGSNSYPPYPSNTGSSNGYPPYPQSTNQAGRNQDSGYPPYPTLNRMPMPGQPSYPNYPNPQSGYPQTHSNNPQQYPGYHGNSYPNSYPPQNYPNQNQRGYGHRSRYGSAASVGVVASVILIGFSELFVLMTTRLQFR